MKWKVLWYNTTRIFGDVLETSDETFWTQNVAQ